MRVAGLQVHDIDLIERVVGLAFALENQAFPVGRKVTLAAAFAFKRELADVLEERRFVFCRKSG